MLVQCYPQGGGAQICKSYWYYPECLNPLLRLTNVIVLSESIKALNHGFYPGGYLNAKF